MSPTNREGTFAYAGLGAVGGGCKFLVFTSIRLTPLLGAAPDQRTGTLQTLYVSQIATIVWVTDSAATGEEIVERRNVIVGLALKRNAGSGSGDGGEEAALTEGERRMFAGVMTLVRDVLDLGR